jgi:uncharacterized membrane protein YfcA
VTDSIAAAAVGNLPTDPNPTALPMDFRDQTRPQVARRGFQNMLTARVFARAAAALLAACVVAESVQFLHEPGANGAAAAVILLASLVASIAGFAFAVLAGSALAFLHFDPVQAVMTLAVCSLAMQAYAVWQLRASIRWPALAPMIAAGALAIPFGVALLLRLDARLYAALLGLLVVGYGGYSLLLPPSRVVRGGFWRDAGVGAAAGLIGGLSGAPGLLVTIWCSLRGWDKNRQRAVYQPFILVMQLVTVASLGWSAPLQLELLPVAKFVPFALLGAIGGFALFQRLSLRQFKLAVSLLLIASGTGLLARAC